MAKSSQTQSEIQLKKSNHQKRKKYNASIQMNPHRRFGYIDPRVYIPSNCSNEIGSNSPKFYMPLKNKYSPFNLGSIFSPEQVQEMHAIFENFLKTYGYPLLIIILVTAMTYLFYSRSIYFPRVVVTKWEIGEISIQKYLWYILSLSLIRFYYFNEFLDLYLSEIRRLCSSVEQEIHFQLSDAEAAYFSLRRLDTFLNKIDRFRNRVMLVWKCFTKYILKARQDWESGPSNCSLNLMLSLSEIAQDQISEYESCQNSCREVFKSESVESCGSAYDEADYEFDLSRKKIAMATKSTRILTSLMESLENESVMDPHIEGGYDTENDYSKSQTDNAVSLTPIKASPGIYKLVSQTNPLVGANENGFFNYEFFDIMQELRTKYIVNSESEGDISEASFRSCGKKPKKRSPTNRHEKTNRTSSTGDFKISRNFSLFINKYFINFLLNLLSYLEFTMPMILEEKESGSDHRSIVCNQFESETECEIQSQFSQISDATETKPISKPSVTSFECDPTSVDSMDVKTTMEVCFLYHSFFH